jgi:hypothetical protein
MQRVPKPAVVSVHNAFMPDCNYGLSGQPTGNAARTAEQLAERTDLLLAKAEVLAHGIGEALPTPKEQILFLLILSGQGQLNAFEDLLWFRPMVLGSDSCAILAFRFNKIMSS